MPNKQINKTKKSNKETDKQKHQQEKVKKLKQKILIAGINVTHPCPKIDNDGV